MGSPAQWTNSSSAKKVSEQERSQYYPNINSSDRIYLISSLRNTSLLLYKLLTMRSMSRLTCQSCISFRIMIMIHIHELRIWKNSHTSAWYSYLSAGGELDADSAAVDSYRLPKNNALFKFGRFVDLMVLDFSELKTEYHLGLPSLSPTCFQPEK